MRGRFVRQVPGPSGEWTMGTGSVPDCWRWSKNPTHRARHGRLNCRSNHLQLNLHRRECLVIARRGLNQSSSTGIKEREGLRGDNCDHVHQKQKQPKTNRERKAEKRGKLSPRPPTPRSGGQRSASSESPSLLPSRSFSFSSSFSPSFLSSFGTHAPNKCACVFSGS